MNFVGVGVVEYEFVDFVVEDYVFVESGMVFVVGVVVFFVVFVVEELYCVCFVFVEVGVY